MSSSRFSNTKGFVLAAASSGVGKTTVAAAICAILKEKGLVVQPFKTGPDYVDPTYLSLAAGRQCRNLDGFPNPELMPFFYREACAAGEGLPAADIAVVEGVMGMYDGLGPEGLYSTAWLANTLGLPVVLLVNAKAAATSVAAVVKGFATLAPLAPRVAGVIANRVSNAGHAETIGEALERFVNVPLIGWIPDVKDTSFASRHLGLIPAQERGGVGDTLSRFQDALREHVDFERLLAIAQPPAGAYREPVLPAPVQKAGGAPLRVAIASDDAFCFQYHDNWSLLRQLGAEIVKTSPMADAALPENTDLLILSGGYPEEFAAELSENVRYQNALRDYAAAGAIYAECGGMLYLTRSISYRGQRHEMAGMIEGDTLMTERLQRFGYVEGCALADNLLFKKGQTVRAHEFHYSKVEGRAPEAFSVRRVSRRGDEWIDGYMGENLLATYLHISFYTCSDAAAQMLRKAAKRGKKN